MSTPAEDREALLAALLAGDVPPDDPRVAALRADPEAARELDELLALREDLDAAGAERAAVLAEAAAAPSPEEARLAELARARLDEGRAGRSWRRWAGLAAAAVVLLAATWAWRATRPDPWRFLGPGDAGLEPRGAVESFDTFRWTYPRPSGGSFRLVVYADPAGEEELYAAELVGNEHAVDPAEAAAWPDRIRWDVVPLDAQGVAQPGWSASARRR